MYVFIGSVKYALLGKRRYMVITHHLFYGRYGVKLKTLQMYSMIAKYDYDNHMIF